jgi:hypothetical protein
MVFVVTLFLQQVHDTIWQRMIALTEAATQTIIIPAYCRPRQKGLQSTVNPNALKGSSRGSVTVSESPTVVAAADHHLDRWLLRQRRLLDAAEDAVPKQAVPFL